ncbi:ABC transporter, permease protein EscB [Geomicrobium sp. JCM 19038]|nr:ABC transporter, permease protein EscB [Geomicrobium sp. JCM 19038]
MLTTTIHLLFILFIVVIVACNSLMKWIERWLENQVQLVLHKLNRFFLLYLMCYFLFNNDWMYMLIVMSIHFAYFFYFIRKKRNLNWQWLIDEEESALIRNYKFINFFIDVPNLKRSFRRRRLLTRILQRCIPFKQSNTFVYLYSHLFARHNDYFYFYLRLTVIGMLINYAIPTGSWIFTLLILYITGSQVIPLQHEMKQSVLLFPNQSQIKDSFLKFVSVMLYAQFFILYFAMFILTSSANLFMLVIGSIFVYVYVYFFVSKRIDISGSTSKN